MRTHRQAIGYLTALIGSVVALAASLMLRQPLEDRPFPIFLVPIMLAGWFGGLGPGLIATVLSGIALVYFFEDPQLGFAIGSIGTGIRLAVFLAIALVMSWLSARMRAALVAAEAGQRAAAEMAALVSSSEDAIVGTTADGTITTWNEGARALCGFSADEIVGLSVEALSPSDRLGETSRVLERIGHGERFGHYSAVWQRKDGSRVPVSLRVSPIRDNHGTIVGGSIIARDTAARAAYEEAIARLAAIVTSSEDAIIGETLDGTITSWNAAAERLYGYSQAEMIGRPTSALVPPDRLDEVQSILDAVRQGERIERLRTVRTGKDGARIDVILTIWPIIDGDGAVIGIARIARGAAGSSGESAPEQVLTRVVHRLSAVGDPSTAVDILLQEAGQVTEADAVLMLWCDESGAVRPVASHPRSSAPIEPLRRGEGVAGLAIERCAPVHANDYASADESAQRARRAGVRAALAVPILENGQPIGALSVSTRVTGKVFNSRDAAVLGLFADAIAPLLTERATEALKESNAGAPELA